MGQKQIDRIATEFQMIQAGVSAGRPFSDEAAVSRRVARILGGASAAKYFTHQMVELTRQREILQLLNVPTPAQFLSRLLPRPPN